MNRFFIFSYVGNKRREFQTFNEYIEYDGIRDIIVLFIEPCAGSASISFNIFEEHYLLYLVGKIQYRLDGCESLICLALRMDQ